MSTRALPSSCRRCLSAALLFGVAAQSAPAGAQDAGSVAGVVATASGDPAEGIRVRIVELRIGTTTRSGGEYRFDDVPPGHYLVEAESPRFGRSIAHAEVEAGRETRLDVTLDVDVHHELVIVTADADPRSAHELTRPVSVLEGSALRLQLEPTLGETLSDLPGVSSSYFGPGASRPVIRGVGGDRIRVLEDGIGSFDASSTSPDHAVSFDPIGAERVEVVRGPATLLYGSSAVGGVVNVIDQRVPDSTSDRFVHGALDVALGSVADERSGAAAVRVGRGPFVVRGEYSRRDAGDLGIPGFAESGLFRALEEAEEGADGDGEPHAEEEESFGVLENSAVESETLGLSAAVVGRAGFVGVAVRGFDTLYGVPGHAHGEGEPGEGEEAPVRVDLDQRRLDLRGGWTQPFGAFRAAKVRFGAADYEHVELEGAEVGTTFLSDGWEGRLELLHQPVGSLSGSFGLQVLGRDFEAVGEEAFVPPTETRGLAFFAFEELGKGPLKGQFGLRYERQSVDARGEAPASRSFAGLSGSIGLVWSAPDGFGTGLTLARSVKLPNAEELFSDGPHVATRSFEVGDPELDDETSLGLDLSVRKRAGRLSGQLSIFGNWFDDYIFERLTGEERDGLRVVRFSQADARFVGAELEAHLDLVKSEPHHLDVEVSGDLVRGRLTGPGEDLPRIPASRLGVGLHYQSEAWDARVEARTSLEQGRTAPFELPTEGFTFLNASVAYRLFLGRAVCDVTLRGRNLTDAEGRAHASFLKDLAPLPGRDVRLGVRLTF